MMSILTPESKNMGKVKGQGLGDEQGGKDVRRKAT